MSINQVAEVSFVMGEDAFYFISYKNRQSTNIGIIEAVQKGNLRRQGLVTNTKVYHTMTRELAEFFESCLWVLMRDMLCSIPQCSWEILSSSDLHPTETLSASTFFEAKLASTQSKPTFCPPGYSRKFQFCSVTGSKMKNTKEMWQW